MSENQRALVVPLRSNAHSLVAGAPAAAVRRRLKFASISFDRLLFEEGRLLITAGPSGSVVLPGNEDDSGFQSPRERHVKPGERMTLALGSTDPTVVPTEMRTFIDTETIYRWESTLQPFIRELPASCDWVHLVRSGRPSGKAAKAISSWSRKDSSSPALVKAFPDSIVRNLVVKHANQDLALAAHSGVAITQDSLHRQVLSSRYDVTSTWQPTAFAMPILLPRVGDLAWEAVARVRNHPGLHYFRELLRELEAELLGTALTGDLEGAAHRAFERYLAEAHGKLETVGSAARLGVMDLVVGGITGAVTSAWAGPAGFAVGTAVGAAPGVASRFHAVRAARQRRGWVATYQSLMQASTPDPPLA